MWSKLIGRMAKEFNFPTKSFAGRVAAQMFARRNAFLEKTAVDLLEIQPDHSILEIGFGPGIGLRHASTYVLEGNGNVCGVDSSPFMVEKASKYCSLEISEQKIQVLLGHVSHLAFPDSIFDGIFHCNCYYFWPDMDRACKELFRVAKPGAKIIATLRLERLKEMARKGFLEFGNTDPLRYMDGLEKAGFEGVGMKYLDYKGKFPYQAILGSKPIDADKFDAEKFEEEMEEFASEIIDYQRTVAMVQLKRDFKNKETEQLTKDKEPGAAKRDGL